ncbi:MAG: hypothetical protein JWP78_1077 [Mucilaginibacter sp.]|nr:hypothetical protein [Mucilaginibacter sp.]
MKKLIIAFLLCGLIFIAGTKTASGQVQLKEIVISGTSGKTVITEKVSDSFGQLFKGAVAPEWVQANKNFIVNFILNNQKNKAEFTSGGRLLFFFSLWKRKGDACQSANHCEKCLFRLWNQLHRQNKI